MARGWGRNVGDSKFKNVDYLNMLRKRGYFLELSRDVVRLPNSKEI